MINDFIIKSSTFEDFSQHLQPELQIMNYNQYYRMLFKNSWMYIPVTLNIDLIYLVYHCSPTTLVPKEQKKNDMVFNHNEKIMKLI